MKIDQATDQLLEEIAAAKEPTPELLRKIVPDRKAFVSYLRERGLLKDETAQSILQSLDAARPAAPKRAARGEKVSNIAPATVAGMVARIARETDLKGADVRRVLHKLMTPAGRLIPKWREKAFSLLRKKRREPVEAQSGESRAKPKRKVAARKAQRRKK
jgi:hypothetical protein